MTHDEPINLVQDHNCFGCGSLNLHGLKLQLHHDPQSNGVWADFTPDIRFEGYGGMVHGGIIATVLDEVMAWSLYRIGAWAVTAKMETRFRQPVAIGEATRATGRIDQVRGSLYNLSSEIRSVSGNIVLAEASAVFMRVPQEQADAWRNRYIDGGPAS
jgi:acyl-coenzyme A thioesterase PaaI-like protein